MIFVVRSNNPYESEVARIMERYKNQPVQIYKKDDCKILPVIDREKWNDCELCGGRSLEEVGIKDYFGYRIVLTTGNGRVPEKERFQFCPKCGKPLNEEAWKELEKKVFDCAD